MWKDARETTERPEETSFATTNLSRRRRRNAARGSRKFDAELVLINRDILKTTYKVLIRATAESIYARIPKEPLETNDAYFVVRV